MSKILDILNGDRHTNIGLLSGIFKKENTLSLCDFEALLTDVNINSDDIAQEIGHFLVRYRSGGVIHGGEEVQYLHSILEENMKTDLGKLLKVFVFELYETMTHVLMTNGMSVTAAHEFLILDFPSFEDRVLEVMGSNFDIIPSKKSDSMDASIFQSHIMAEIFGIEYPTKVIRYAAYLIYSSRIKETQVFKPDKRIPHIVKTGIRANFPPLEMVLGVGKYYASEKSVVLHEQTIGSKKAGIIQRGQIVNVTGIDDNWMELSSPIVGWVIARSSYRNEPIFFKYVSKKRGIKRARAFEA